jgi:outer membrane protein insertion porin family
MSAIRIIKNFYQEKGFYNTSVDIETKPEGENGVFININVAKGPRIKIETIEFDGNTQFSDAVLKKKLKETKEARMYRIFKRSKYIKGSFSEDLQKLITYYNSEGYRDAKINKDSVKQVGKNRLAVNVDLYEGKKYFIRNIDWTGNYKYDTKVLSTLLGIKKGDKYDASYIDKRLTMDPNGGDISSLYMDDGYLFFNVTPLESLVEGDSIDLEMRVYEGSQATINRIIIEGNTKTSDHVILRELRTYPGNKFSRSDIIRSQREIVNLNYFDPENIGLQPVPDVNTGTVDIKYTVQEKPSDQLQLQGGWGGRIRDNQGNIIGGGLVGTVSLTFNNFSTKRFFDAKAWQPLPSGDGQRLSLTFQTNGRAFQNYAISFLEPWFGGKKPHSFGVNTNYSVQQSLTTNYRIGIFGTSIDLGRRMKFPDDFFRSYTSFGYRFYDLREAATTFNINNGQVNIFSIKQNFDRTSIDQPIYPRSGSIFSFTVQLTPPYSLFQPNKDYEKLKAEDNYEEIYRFLEFHKWKLDNSWFMRVHKNLVLNAKMRWGFIGFYNASYGLSPFERFYLGGDGLQGFNLDGREIIGLRGYQNNSIGPRDFSGSIQGSTIYNKFTLELRQLLTPAKSQQTVVWIHGFLEGGNGWANFKEFNPFVIKRSAGLGARVFLPMLGQLGLDWGYGFDPIFNENDGLHKGRFHFTFGQQF